MTTYFCNRYLSLLLKNGKSISSFRKVISNQDIFLERRGGIKLLKREISFFKSSSKNNIIKNEFDKILREKDEVHNEISENEKTSSLHVRSEKQNDELQKDEKHKKKKKEKFQKTKGKFKRLFIFITFQSIPIVGLMYLFKYLESVKLSELNYFFNTSEDIIKEATKLIDGNSTCFCLYFYNNQINTIFIDPLNSENCEKNYENTNLTSLSLSPSPCPNASSSSTSPNRSNVNISQERESSTNDKNENNTREKPTEKNSLENIMYSLNKGLMQNLLSQKSFVKFPLNYIYFSIAKNSDIYKYLKKSSNEITLLYSDEKKNIYVTLNGKASIIKSDEIKNIMWTDKWSYIISNEDKENYILIKFTPAVISLKTIGLKDEHWKNNVVIRKIKDDMCEWEKI